ncbi:hypothetical protein BH09BAC1_BH09BAC1_19720 [soil metagenome]
MLNRIIALLLLLATATSCDKRHINSNEEAIGNFDILADIVKIVYSTDNDTSHAYNVSYRGIVRAPAETDSIGEDFVILQYFTPYNDMGEMVAHVGGDSIYVDRAVMPIDSASGKGKFKGLDLIMNFDYRVGGHTSYSVTLIATKRVK